MRSIVPIGGGGLISGVSMAVKSHEAESEDHRCRIVGAPGMQASVAAGHVVTLDRVDCIIDGLRVKRVGEYDVRGRASRFVDEIVTLPDSDMFEAVALDHGALQTGRRRRRRGAGRRAAQRPGQRCRRDRTWSAC